MTQSNNIRQLSPVLKQIADIELNENYQTLRNELTSLREWIEKQPHLKTRTDDQFLLAFLRSSKHSLERTKEKLDSYYTIRTAIPEIFANQDPHEENIQKVLDYGISIYLPKPHLNGERVILNRLCIYDPEKTSLYNILKYAFMESDLAMINDDHLIVAGQIIIIDVNGLSLAHANQMTPTLLKKFTKVIQEAYPYRQKGIHFLNLPKIFDFLFKLFHSFLDDKFKQRIYVHDSLDSLHKHIPKNVLPKEYGGELGSVNDFIENSKKEILTNREWFLENAAYKTDESKRAGVSKYSDLFGMDGTFKRLEVD